VTHNPTDEQLACLDKFRTGEGLAIAAGAGTGKTTTLAMLTRSTNQRVQYTAFNKKLVTDSASKFGDNVSAKTTHSVCFAVTGRPFQHRLQSKRMRAREVARFLDIGPIVVDPGAGKPKVLQPDFLAGLVMRSVQNFCQSADETPSSRHVPYVEGIDMPTDTGVKRWDNNMIVRAAIAPAILKAWADQCNPDGFLRYSHDSYVKNFQLGRHQIGAPIIMLDEAQDTAPVMLAILANQVDAQIIAVGDENQAIYGWRGAVDAMSRLELPHRCTLSQSFRFGPEVALAANLILEQLPTDLRLRGTETLDSVLAPCTEDAFPDAVLTRTNAGALERVLSYQKRGKRVHLVGGGTELVSFAKAAADLMQRIPVNHPELACFDSWTSVQEYVKNDPQGDELRLMVKLVDDYTVPVILEALDTTIPEATADVTVCTAHKSKGLEWDTVQLAGDFPTGDDDKPMGDEEWRLAYVAATRAQLHLDAEAHLPLAQLLIGEFGELPGHDNDPTELIEEMA
jgi:hypothetical protein